MARLLVSCFLVALAFHVVLAQDTDVKEEESPFAVIQKLQYPADGQQAPVESDQDGARFAQAPKVTSKTSSKRSPAPDGKHDIITTTTVTTRQASVKDPSSDPAASPARSEKKSAPKASSKEIAQELIKALTADGSDKPKRSSRARNDRRAFNVPFNNNNNNNCADQVVPIIVNSLSSSALMPRPVSKSCVSFAPVQPASSDRCCAKCGDSCGDSKARENKKKAMKILRKQLVRELKQLQNLKGKSPAEAQAVPQASDAQEAKLENKAEKNLPPLLKQFEK